MNDFIALLVAVTAFLLAMLAGQALLWAVQAVWGRGETILAFGPILRILASLGIAMIAYRRLVRRGAA